MCAGTLCGDVHGCMAHGELSETASSIGGCVSSDTAPSVQEDEAEEAATVEADSVSDEPDDWQ
eukprot:2622372-Heterocapsa_arctica.AAC.1